MPVYNIILNSSNVVGTTKSNYEYNFINGNFDIFDDASMTVSQVVIPYSWFNLNNANYNNTTFSFYFGDTTMRTIIFPDGYYTVSDIQNYIEQYCITNSLYKIDTLTGDYVYYIYITSNQTYYANQILLFTVESIAQTNFTYPIGFPFSPNNYSTVVYFSSLYNFGSILGFSSGQYPMYINTVNNSFLSNTTPNLTPVNGIVLRCNIVNNECSSQSDILDTFNINSPFGSNISYNPSYEKWINIKAGSYSKLYLYFQDQNLNNITFNDSNVLISLLIKQGFTKHTINKQIKTIKTLEI